MTDDKFILMNMDDERSGHIAEVLKNPTCKKMLNYLGDIKEASEKDISDALKMPINTVEYNLNKLIKSGLVDKTKNFFWSVKGKKIPMYKLARKHIIISPSKRPDMNYIRSIVPVILIAVVLIAILSSIYLFPKQAIISEKDGIMQFTSQEELNDFIKSNSNTNFGYYGLGGMDMVVAEDAPIATGAAKSADSSFASASDYSTTNIQVEGVDEADIVKNDGKYIYVVSGNKVKIIDAYPAENMNILSEIDINGVNNIFINKDKLIVFANDYRTYGIAEKVACLGCDYGGYGGLSSLVYIYDIKDRENPVLEGNFSFEGNYVDSRMINDYVYIISTKYVNTENPEPPIYYANGVENIVRATDVAYWPYPDSSYVFTSIIGINLKDNKVNSKVFLTGSTNTLFVSQDNIYLTYQKFFDYKEYAEKIAEEVYYPLLPSEEDSKIRNILDSDKNSWQKVSEMQILVKDYSNNLKGEEFSDFSKKLNDRLEEFNIGIQKETEKTIIHKINVNKENIEYLGVGEVPGRILNQFSMDEYKGNFRIATTTGNNGNVESLNHLYILDEDLNIAGSVEDLAKGERIYSARFLGDRAYMVTFKQVDPLFVIDLKNPEKPEVLGYLKIPGYSDYLHPYDEDYIIGIGRSATEEGRVQGMKIALFDVSEVTNPVEESKLEIGSRGTNSPALYDHKAFLFDKSRNLLVIPIQVYEDKQMSNEFSSWIGSDIIFNGAYVFNIDLNGIELRGKITHFDSKSKYGAASEDEIGTKRIVYGQTYVKVAENSWEINKTYYDYGYDYYSKTIYSDEYMDLQQGGIKYNNLYDYQYQIQRSLFMDNVLYTISQAKIKANDLDSIDKINNLDLDYNQDYPIYYGEDIIAI